MIKTNSFGEGDFVTDSMLIQCIFIRYCKEDTCYTLVDLGCTFDSYIVYHGSSKKVLTALVTLADCVGSLNRLSAVSRFSPR